MLPWTHYRPAEQEKQSGTDASRGLCDEARLIGVIDPREAFILQQMRRKACTQQGLLSTVIRQVTLGTELRLRNC